MADEQQSTKGAAQNLTELLTCVRLLNQSNKKLRKQTHQRKEPRKKKEKKT